MLNKREFVSGVVGVSAVTGAGIAVAAPESASQDAAPFVFIKHDIVLVYGDGPERQGVNWSFDDDVLASDGPVCATIDTMVDMELAGCNIRHVELSERAYRCLRRSDLIDRVRNSDGEVLMYTFLGHLVHVPGSAI